MTRHNIDFRALSQHLPRDNYPNLTHPYLAGDSKTFFHHTGKSALTNSQFLTQGSYPPATPLEHRIELYLKVSRRIEIPPKPVRKQYFL